MPGERWRGALKTSFSPGSVEVDVFWGITDKIILAAAEQWYGNHGGEMGSTGAEEAREAGSGP